MGGGDGEDQCGERITAYGKLFTEIYIQCFCRSSYMCVLWSSLVYAEENVDDSLNMWICLY